MARPKASSADDPLVDLHITILASMKQQLEDRKVNASGLIRGFLNGYLNSDTKEEEMLRKKREEIEPIYLGIKAKLEEIDKGKQAAKLEEDQKQAKRDKWFKEIADWIEKEGPNAYKLQSMVEQRAGYCEMSLDEFKTEFEKKYPGQISKVYHQPESRRPRQ